MEKHDGFYIFTGLIEENSVQQFANFVMNTPGNLLVSIRSGGGNSDSGFVMERILAENVERISLCAMAGIYSCAFRVFYNFKGKRFLVPEAKGMYHLGHADIRLNVDGTCTYDEDKALRETQMEFLEEHKAFAKSFMTESEFEKYLKGDEVYFAHSRMVEIFPTAEIL